MIEGLGQISIRAPAFTLEYVPAMPGIAPFACALPVIVRGQKQEDQSVDDDPARRIKPGTAIFPKRLSFLFRHLAQTNLGSAFVNNLGLIPRNPESQPCNFYST